MEEVFLAYNLEREVGRDRIHDLLRRRNTRRHPRGHDTEAGMAKSEGVGERGSAPGDSEQHGSSRVQDDGVPTTGPG